MIARTPCPVALCMWFSGLVAPDCQTDPAVDVPPWCLQNWAVVADGYGSSLTVAQVIGAHVASHFPGECSVRMPSRAEVEQVNTQRSKEYTSRACRCGRDDCAAQVQAVLYPAEAIEE